MRGPRKPKIRFRKWRAASDWDVFRNDEHLGTILHVFTKPSEYRNIFSNCTNAKPKNMRRGWTMSAGLANAIDTPFSCIAGKDYYMFPLMEAKALVRHCLLNRTSLRGMNGDDIINLAKHCRRMELAR